MLNQIRIVLVKTSHPGNIGAAARALKNMGLTQLYLVQPIVLPDPEASARASHAIDVLAKAVIVESLSEAIADCSLIVGASARKPALQWPIKTASENATLMLDELRKKPKQSMAILFGEERCGLQIEALQQCHYQLKIPTSNEYHSLNLAQAVQIVCYELHIKLFYIENQLHTQHDRLTAPLEIPIATASEVEGFFQHFKKVMIAVNFLNHKQPHRLLSQLRRLVARARLSRTEINILRGMLTATQNTVLKKPKLEDKKS